MSEETRLEKDEPVLTNSIDLVKPLAENMPVPTGEPVTEQKDFGFPAEPPAENQSETVPETYGEIFIDKSGTKFDPQKHRWDEEAKKPKYNEEGNFVSTRGRKSGGKNSTSNSPVSESSIRPPDQFDIAAKLYFDMGTGVLQGVISDEWKPDDENERQGMIQAVASYLRATGHTEVSPGMALTFALCAYAGKRLGRPNTKEKLVILWLKLKGWFNGLKS